MTKPRSELEDARPGTFWRITGQLWPGFKFTDTPAVVLPHAVTGGATRFALMPPLDEIVRPERITEAVPLVLMPVPRSQPFGDEVTADGVQKVWNTFCKPSQSDDSPPQSVEMRQLMAILRAVHEGMTQDAA